MSNNISRKIHGEISTFVTISKENKLKIVENTTKNEKKCLWLKLWGPTTQLDTN